MSGIPHKASIAVLRLGSLSLSQPGSHSTAYTSLYTCKGIQMAAIKISKVTLPKQNWVMAHNEAIDWPKGFESLIGEDYVLGPEWTQIGTAIRGLLNGETGRLDCGTLDGFILETMRENGVEKDGL
jgi:hypothetical protein